MLLEEARERCADVLGAQVEEIVFTSGATESNNLAIRGWMRQQAKGSHILISAVEHPSVWDCARALEDEGYVVETIPVSTTGAISVDWVAAHLRPATQMVSVMAVNNEVGTVQPIAALRAMIPTGVKLHVDAVQAAVVEEIPRGCDFLSISAHKLGGPVGSGLLYLRQGLRVDPLFLGGAQEDSRRAGTSNVAGAAALALALEETRATLSQTQALLVELKQRLEAGLSAIPGAISLSVGGSPHISSWAFEGVVAEPLLVRLDLQGISASSGSGLQLPQPGTLAHRAGDGLLERHLPRTPPFLPGIRFHVGGGRHDPGGRPKGRLAGARESFRNPLKACILAGLCRES